MRHKQKVELLAFATWAKEKCTTPHGIDVDAWIALSPRVKATWLRKGESAYRALGVK